uniref:Nucleoside diphosphate kinase n=1 Tax=Ditylenchus dipsaci TaxID=166011 RepID=A0A915E1N9_9BILA
MHKHHCFFDFVVFSAVCDCIDLQSSMNRFVLICALVSLSSAVHLSVKNGDTGKYCLILDSTITGQVQYHNMEQQTVTYGFAVNGTAVEAIGKCFDVDKQLQNTVETISIHFLPNDFAHPNDTTASFKLADYHLAAVFYPTFNASLPDNTTDVFHYKKPAGTNLEWGAVDTHGFSCSKANLPLTNSSWVDFAHLKVLAFAVLDTDQFPENQLFEQCKMDVKTSDIVPIIVGICLAGLVIIVLVAYLIGRARAKRQGYASV